MSSSRIRDTPIIKIPKNMDVVDVLEMIEEDYELGEPMGEEEVEIEYE